MKNWKPFVLIAALGWASCDKSIDTTLNNKFDRDNLLNASAVEMPASFKFNFSQHSTWSGTVRVKGYQGPIPGIPLVLTNGSDTVEIGFTNANGEWPITVDRTEAMNLEVHCAFPSLQGSYTLLSDGFEYTFSPRTYQDPQLEFPQMAKSNQAALTSRGGNWYDDRLYANPSWSNYAYLPQLESHTDELSDDFLTYIHNSVPEQYPIGRYNPELLASGNTSLHLDSAADVYMTYISEGAGYKNVIGYFLYNDNNVPTSASDIDTIYTAFENFSQYYSGGNLQLNDRIYLGSYPAGTNIGFVLKANGFAGHGAPFQNTLNQYYTLPELNPELTEEKRKHNIIFFDPESDRFVIGWEDMHRQGGSDDDFNDAIFYISSNPETAIDTVGIARIVTQVSDSDYDGVPDQADIAPNNPNFATEANYSGRFVFEDLFPYKGDYDFNDIVMDYNATVWKNGAGAPTRITYTFYQRADGGTLPNGFGFALTGVDPMEVSNITFGQSGSSFEDDGTEAVFILADELNWNASNTYVNVYNHQDKQSNYPSYSVTFDLTGTTATSIFWGNTLDAFIFNDANNPDGRNEIHTKYKRPTNKANLTKIGIGQDITILNPTPTYVHNWVDGRPAVDYGMWIHNTPIPMWVTFEGSFQTDTIILQPTATTYCDTMGMPWAMHLDQTVLYPVEKRNIRKAYSQFTPWVANLGELYTTWYESPNRDSVYVK